MAWIDADFPVPQRLDLETGEHLRPMRAADVDIDYPAVMGSRERLWEKYGEAWGWPPAHMTYEIDKEDLAHHEAEIRAKETFLYGVFDEAESKLIGCLYIDPPDAEAPPEADATVSWWVIDSTAGTPLERALDRAIPQWLAEVWGFRSLHRHP